MVSRLPFGDGDESQGFAIDLAKLLGQRPRDSHLDACWDISERLVEHLFDRNDYNDALRERIDAFSNVLSLCSPLANATDFDVSNTSTAERIELLNQIVLNSQPWLSIGSSPVDTKALASMLVWQRASIAFTVIVVALNTINHLIHLDNATALSWSASHPDFSVQACACGSHGESGKASS